MLIVLALALLLLAANLYDKMFTTRMLKQDNLSDAYVFLQLKRKGYYPNMEIKDE